MLVIKNIGLAVFKVKFAPNTPTNIQKAVGGSAKRNETITVPTVYMDYIDMTHLRRCERNRVVRIYGIRDVVKSPTPVAKPVVAKAPKDTKQVSDKIASSSTKTKVV